MEWLEMGMTRKISNKCIIYTWRSHMKYCIMLFVLTLNNGHFCYQSVFATNLYLLKSFRTILMLGTWNSWAANTSIVTFNMTTMVPVWYLYGTYNFGTCCFIVNSALIFVCNCLYVWHRCVQWFSDLSRGGDF